MKKSLTRTPNGLKSGSKHASVCVEWQDRIFGSGKSATLSSDQYALDHSKYDVREVVIFTNKLNEIVAVLDGQIAFPDYDLESVLQWNGKPLENGVYTLFTPIKSGASKRATLRKEIDALVSKLYAALDDISDIGDQL